MAIRAQTAAAGAGVEAATAAILADSKVIKTLEDIKADDDRALVEQKRITEIPAPAIQGAGQGHVLPEAVPRTRLQGPPRSTPRAM